MITLTLSLNYPFQQDGLEIAVVNGQILVSALMMEGLRRVGGVSGDMLYSLLEDYPQALPGAERFTSLEALHAHAKEVMAQMAPLLSPGMSGPRKRVNYTYGAVIPDALPNEAQVRSAPEKE